jgi:Zn-dependent protease with chaperone function
MGDSMKKLAWWFLAFYIVYIILMACYLFLWSGWNVPPSYKGTAADPELFMTQKQLTMSTQYSQIEYWLSFISIPLDWGIYLFVMAFGFSKWLEKRSREITRFSIVHTAIYFLALSVLTWLIAFPIDYAAHLVSIHFGVSVQPFHDWLRDHIISFWVNWLISFLMVVVIYFFIRKYRRWWLPVWLLSIPFTVFLMYIQPVVIDPLYNHFKPLQDNELKQEILDLAAKANIPADDVYEVDMSKKTNAMNAYVNGIGSNLRIVLWDTTLHKLKDDEVLFVMAHEMGHYVKHHLFWSLIGAIFATLVGLLITRHLYHGAVRKWGGQIGVSSSGDLACVPILLLIISVLSFAATPIENAVSRYAEHSADVYAIQLTHDKEAGIDSFQKLTTSGLGEVNPPALVKFFMYDHPTMMERIHFLETYPIKK